VSGTYAENFSSIGLNPGP